MSTAGLLPGVGMLLVLFSVDLGSAQEPGWLLRTSLDRTIRFSVAALFVAALVQAVRPWTDEIDYAHASRHGRPGIPGAHRGNRASAGSSEGHGKAAQAHARVIHLLRPLHLPHRAGER